YHSELQLRQQLLWYARRRDAAAERERHALEMSRVGNELEAENAQLRHLESRVETARAAHYGAGDGLNAAQAALYAANAEVARFESELRHVEETRQRLEGQHTERLAQLGSWREQRAQLTQALHMWAARAGTARERRSESPRSKRPCKQRRPGMNRCKPSARRSKSAAPQPARRSARRSASTRPPRRSLRPCARSRPRPKTTRPCANGSSGTAWARCRACGRSCASTGAGRPPWNGCCANACTRSSFPRLPGCSRFLPIGH